MEFHNHIENIEKLCRICGNFIKIQRGYMNPKTTLEYIDVLQEFYGIYATEDPQVLCVNL